MLIAVQVNRAGTRTDNKPYSNVRLYRETKANQKKEPNKYGGAYLGEVDCFGIVHPGEIGLDHWNGSWMDDCGYLTDEEVAQLMIEVGNIQAGHKFNEDPM
jgi:hypothetical protein